MKIDRKQTQRNRWLVWNRPPASFLLLILTKSAPDNKTSWEQLEEELEEEQRISSHLHHFLFVTFDLQALV